jgi:Flp pilus assembly protein TadD
LQPEDPSIQNNLAYFIGETNGNLDEAMSLAQQAVRKSPAEPVFADTLGWIYTKKGMASKAVQLFENLVRKNPEDPTFQYHFGAALLRTGNKEKARTALQIALTKNPSKQEAEKIRALLARIG